MERSFSGVNEAFAVLKSKFQASQISRQEFIEEMKKLRIRDDQGRFWMIGAQTGKWYFFDGKDWVRAEPPSQKDHSAICVYCGFENRLEAPVCARCGGTIGEEPSKCPDCGSPLRRPFLTCPKCGIVPGGEIAETTAFPTPETGTPAAAGTGTSALRPAGTGSPAAGGSIVIGSVRPASLFFFWGVFGLLAGSVAGAFVGSTGALAPYLGFLPESLQRLQGTLFGAAIDAVAGGVLGFPALGAVAFLFGVLANLIFTLTGGIEVRTRPAARAGKPGKAAAAPPGAGAPD